MTPDFFIHGRPPTSPPNFVITFIPYLIAGYNLTWRTVQELFYCCKNASLLSIGAFLKMHVLTFGEQN